MGTCKNLLRDSTAALRGKSAQDIIYHPVFIAIIIAVVTFATFSQVLNNDFVLWDDDRYIYENPNLGGLNLKNLQLIFTDSMSSSSWYTPLAGLRWTITYQLFGLNPYGYHLGNLLFHTMSAILVFFLLRNFLILTKINVALHWLTISSGLATLVWALHPLRVEPVAGAAGGAYTQAICFVLISLLFYLSVANSSNTIIHRRLYLAISVFFYIASILSQPITLGFAAVPFILDVYPLNRLGGSNGWLRTASARKVLLEKIPFVLVAIVCVAVTIAILVFIPKDDGHQSVSIAEFGLFSRFMQAIYIAAYYIYRPFYPLDLAPVYTTLVSFNPLSLPFVLSGFFVFTICIVALFYRKRWPIGVMLLATYIILLIPVMGFLEHPHYHVDRYSLVPSICLSIGVAFLLINLKNKYIIGSSVVLLLMVISILGLLSSNQIKTWRNSEFLFTHMIETLGTDPYRSDIYWRLGKYYLENGQQEKAIINFKKTLEIFPYHPIAYRYLEAIASHNTAVRLNKRVFLIPESR